MKIQIAHLSSHQNAKVFAVLMALGSLLFVIPMAIAFSFMPPGVDSQGHPVQPPPAWIFLFLPIAYFFMGYLITRLGCAFYNFMFKYIGGFEYEARD